MANAVVAAWTACIKELQQLVDATGAVTQAQIDATYGMIQHLHKLEAQPRAPLPHTAWKKLAQDLKVTAKLAALCLHALQHHRASASDVPAVAFNALTSWLSKASHTIRASPGSRAAAVVRQQLQDSALLQHLGPAMEAASDQLTAAVAALEAVAANHCSRGGGGDTAVAAFTPVEDILWLLPTRSADTYCALLLSTFKRASLVLSPVLPTGLDINMQIIQPAAPAAVHLIHCILRAHGKLSQLSQQQLLPQPVRDYCSKPYKALTAVSGVVLVLADALKGNVPSVLQSCPAADTLLLMPEFAACLAIMSIVELLAVDTSSSGGGAMDAASSSSSGVHRSTGSRRRAPTRSQQQQQQPSSGGDGGGSDVGIGVRMDSLTPLSLTLFDLLGVSKETVMQLAVQQKAEEDACLRTLGMYTERCRSIMKHQVDQAQGVFTAQLLQQLETDMLLCLAVLQLAATIPGNSPGAQAARDRACQLCMCSSLHDLWRVHGLHKLPRPAAYTGPQVALQLLPSPLEAQQPASPVLQHQQQQQQQQQLPHQQQQQQQEWCTLAPTPPLLSELLPLLTRTCLTQLQQQQQQQGQERSVNMRIGHPFAVLTQSVRCCLSCLATLLACSVVPAPAAAAQGLPAAAATDTTAADAEAEVEPAAVGASGQVSYSCVLHAQDVLMAHACAIISTFEMALRCEAARCDAAAATATVAGGAAAAAAAAGAAGAGSPLVGYATVIFGACSHKVAGVYPHHASPLALLAAAAGPGSQVQQQLYSLFTTMVKLSGWGKGRLGDHARLQYHAAAASAAVSVLQTALGLHPRQPPAEGREAGCSSSSSSGVALAMLPSVVILGRTCMHWADYLQTDPTLSRGQQQQLYGSQQQQQQQQQGLLQFEWRRLGYNLGVMNEWLAASSTGKQLAAAGYAVEPVVQLLDHYSDTYLTQIGGPSNPTAGMETAQQLQNIGLALCSFAAPCMCNNPCCTSMLGLSEIAAVSGRSCICAGCLVARYCGRACQRAAWKRHKPVCGALSSAAAARGGDAGAS